MIRRARSTLRAVAASLIALTACGPTYAQDFPTRPIRMIIGVPPGGTTDILGRMLAVPLSERLGRQVVIDNRPGASGIIATGLVVKSQPDGYTLTMAGSSITTIGSLYANVPFDVGRDLVPVAFIATTPVVIVVHPTLPVHSLKELIAHVKAQPDGLNFAGSTAGTVQHLSGELLKRMTGMKLTYVPYKGTGAVLPDLLAGRLPVAIENVVTMRPHMRSGAVRGLAVTSAARSAVVPELPTVAEAGVAGFHAVTRFAIFAPVKTPRAVVDRLNTELAAIINLPEIRERLLAQGAEPGTAKPEVLRTEVLREIEQWGKVIRDAGLKFN